MRVYFILLISFVLSLSGLSKAQVKPPEHDQMLILTAVSLELLRRAAENVRYSNAVISGPAMDNALRLLSGAARNETRTEIDKLLSQPQQEGSGEVASVVSGVRPVTYNSRILVASGQSIQQNGIFEAPERIGSTPVYWESHNLDEPRERRHAYDRFNEILADFSANGVTSFIDRNTLEHADNSFLQIIGVARIDRPLSSIFEEPNSISIPVLANMQALASEHQRDSLTRNSQIVSHLDFTEQLSHLIPAAFSPRADFGRLLTLGNQQVSLRGVVQDNYLNTSEETASLISITRFVFHALPVATHSVLGGPLRLVQGLDENQFAREYTLITELSSLRPPASGVPPRLFGMHQTTTHRLDINHRLDLRKDGSFSMTRDYWCLSVSGTWMLVPYDSPLQYRIHFFNIQNNSALLPDHEFKDFSVNFHLADTVIVLDDPFSLDGAKETGKVEIYTYCSSIVFEQNPVEMVYRQYPHPKLNNGKNKKTFYPSSGQVRGYYKLPPKN